MLTAKISAWMEENLPRHIDFSEGKRHVRFGELPAYGCGGTHVCALREIGLITLTNVKMKKVSWWSAIQWTNADRSLTRGALSCSKRRGGNASL
jgi:Ser-tRNA(Ala) deacylase AlaX